MQAVPSSEVLRQAALQASWRRDMRVGLRRRAWRWVEWLLTRWCLPVLAAALLGHVPSSLQPDRSFVQVAPEGIVLKPSLTPNLPPQEKK
ncbi:hypothetical protein [Caenimonas sp. SL110]|uniref:hypothetical protein n=1 Tax=Caenimonas sp. SL110 TaxID=1450524 RepID=UPI000652DF2E|nr:hypothetical protein [Caenimonas sp. SL110]